MTRSLIVQLISIAGLVLATAPVFAQADPHAGHTQETTEGQHVHPAGTQDLPPFMPSPTDEDRKAAFPDVEGHSVHGNAINYFVLLDQLEWQAHEGANGINLDSRGWIGRDRDRLWFRAEGDGESGHVGEANGDGPVRSAVLTLVGRRRRHPSGLSAWISPDVGCGRCSGAGALLV